MAFRMNRSYHARSSRRGAVVVMVALLLTGLLGFGAFAVDLSQVMAHRSELQRAADAAALAGVVRLMTTSPNFADDDAMRYSALNRIMGDTARITVDYGNWDGVSFSKHSCSPGCGVDGAYENAAIRVQLSSTSPSIFAKVLGVDSTVVQAEAIAWASPNVELTDCVKPFAIPYQALTGAIDRLTLQPGSLNRSLTQRDLLELRRNPTLLKFCLKEGEVCAAGDTILGAGQYPSSFLVVDLGGGQARLQENLAKCVPSAATLPGSDSLLAPDSVVTVLSGNADYVDEVTDGLCPGGACAPTPTGSAPWCNRFGSLPCAMKVVLYDADSLSSLSASLCVADVTGQCKVHRIASIVMTRVRSGPSRNPLMLQPRIILDGYFAANIDHGNVGCTAVRPPSCQAVDIRRTTLMRPILVQ